MSATHPFRASLRTLHPMESEDGARESALLQELQNLRAENDQLRRSLEQQLSLANGSDVSRGETGLAVELDLTQSAAGYTAAKIEYDSLLDALGKVFPIGVFRTDAVGTLTHVDSNLQRIVGLHRSDMPNYGWVKVVHPDDRERVIQRWSEAVLKDESQSLECRLLRDNGQVVHALVRNTPTHDATGRFTGHIGFLQDISELRSLEAEAKLKEELNRQIIASSPDCTKVLDLAGRVLQMTAHGCELVEVDDFEAVRQSDWSTWWPEEGAAQVRDALQAALRGEAARFVAYGPTFKGTPKWWDTVISPIRNVQGQTVMLLAVSRDISELHRQQAEIRSLNDGLEARVLQRTQELALANARISETLDDAQSLYHQAPCGYHSVDGDDLFVRINQTELDWLGYQRDEVIGQLHFRDLVVPEDVERVNDRLARLKRGESLDSIKVRLRRRNGDTLSALLSSTAVLDAQGWFLQTNNTLVDITARQNAEAALSAQRSFLQTITDQVPGLIAYLDPDLRFRFANAEHLRVFGMDPKQLIGQHLRDCVPSDVWKGIASSVQSALAGEPQRFEAWRETVQGGPLYFSISYLPDVQDGRVNGVFVQMIDITERKRIEQRVSDLNVELETRIRERSAELLESEQRFRLMVDNLREYSVYFLDAAGCITDWTDSAQRMDGFSPTEMLGRHFAVVCENQHPGGGQELAEKVLRLAASRGQHEVNTWHQRKDGSSYWAHSLLIALRDLDGELQGFAKINRDMSDAKRLDDLMRNINEELENRVAERTEQLLAANKDLESFSYSVSHDLRSPLRHISSFVSLLQEHLGEHKDEVMARYLGTIANSARHMSQLIDGLLAFSRLGRAAVNVTPVDFNLLVGTVVAQLAHDIEGRVVDFVVAPDLPVVQGDALLLREIWANLLGNAYKYSRPRERARIEVGWSVDPAVGYTFFVRDNGVGFDTKYAHKLFGVFQRLHRASEFEGTGIGLALTRRIVERHSGSIWAESEPGVGSVFYFSLPFESFQAADFVRESGFGALT